MRHCTESTGSPQSYTGLPPFLPVFHKEIDNVTGNPVAWKQGDMVGQSGFVRQFLQVMSILQTCAQVVVLPLVLDDILGKDLKIHNTLHNTFVKRHPQYPYEYTR